MSAWPQKLLIILLHRLSSISPILGLYFALGLYSLAASVFVLLYQDRVSRMVMLINCFWIANFIITTVVVRIGWFQIADFVVTTRSATVGVNITPLEREGRA